MTGLFYLALGAAVVASLVRWHWERVRCWFGGHDDVLLYPIAEGRRGGLNGFCLQCLTCGRMTAGFHHER